MCSIRIPDDERSHCADHGWHVSPFFETKAICPPSHFTFYYCDGCNSCRVCRYRSKLRWRFRRVKDYSLRCNCTYCCTVLYWWTIYHRRETFRRILPWSTFCCRYGGPFRNTVFYNSFTNLLAHRMPYGWNLQRLWLRWEHCTRIPLTENVSCTLGNVHRYHSLYFIFQCLRCVHHQICLGSPTIYNWYVPNVVHLGHLIGHR